MLGPFARHNGWAPGPIGDWKNGATGWVLWISLAIMLGDSLTSLSLLLITSLQRRFTVNRQASSDCRTLLSCHLSVKLSCMYTCEQSCGGSGSLLVTGQAIMLVSLFCSGATWSKSMMIATIHISTCVLVMSAAILIVTMITPIEICSSLRAISVQDNSAVSRAICSEQQTSEFCVAVCLTSSFGVTVLCSAGPMPKWMTIRTVTQQKSAFQQHGGWEGCWCQGRSAQPC